MDRLALRRIILAMAHAAAGGHVLHFAGANNASIAHGILVFERAAEHVSDNLHVRMRMRAEAHAGHDEVVINDAQAAKAHPLRIIIIRETEGVI